MSHELNRRQFLTIASTACGALLLPRLAWPRAPLAANDPHFFVQIVLSGGADSSYLFDARPLAMTAAGKIQNYLGQEPIPMTGTNGNTCLRSPLTSSLSALFNRFTVVNGVVMTPSFDGHDQNMNFLFTGSPFGGESYLPHLNRNGAGSTPSALDGVLNGTLPLDATNHGGLVPLDPGSLQLLKDKLGSLPAERESDLSKFIRSRLEANSAGGGTFSRGSRAMLDGFLAGPVLREKIMALEAPDSSLSADRQFVALLGSIFKNDMARSALWTISEPFDVHSADQAAGQPKLFEKAAGRLEAILRALSDSPFDEKRSLLDVTTVMISSEFSRTMRQTNVAIDRTGTDHNPLCNSFLFAGKGIKPAQVIGASDFQSADEVLSRAHTSFDRNQMKLMGRPFDFAVGRPSPALPEIYDPARYLTVASLVNTVYSLFAVPASYHRTLDRAGTLAPQLPQLLT